MDIDLRALGLAVMAAIAIMWMIGAATYSETSEQRAKEQCAIDRVNCNRRSVMTASESCYTDHPQNIVMCVDLGMGHHDLMKAIPHQ